MKKISIALVSVLAAASMTLGACKKAEEKPAEPAAEPAPAPAPTPEPPKAEPAPAPAEPAVDEKADYVKVEASHAQPKPEDPVVVAFDKFAVTKANIKDTANLEGSTAELEIDLTSLKTDSPKRDAHLNSPDYLDTVKFAKATVKIDKVKKSADGYTGEATVSAHGQEKKYPITFQVVETLPDAVRVKGEQKITLADFKLGKEKDEGVANDLTVKLQLTLKKT
jgi:polyisoprenoid-binding protein YceI